MIQDTEHLDSIATIPAARPRSAPNSAPPSASRRRGAGRWLRGAGLAGFLFFLIKGLMWLALPGLIALWRLLER